MARIPQFTEEEMKVAHLTDAEFREYLSTQARDGTLSLEECFHEHLFHDTVGSGENFVISGGEVHAPAGFWSPSFSSFVDWAVSEGLLVVTDKARRVPPLFTSGEALLAAAE